MAKRKTNNIDLDAKLLGLDKVLEDSILDIMEDFVTDRFNTNNNKNKLTATYDNFLDKERLQEYIRKIVYEVLEEIMGASIKNHRSFIDYLSNELEKRKFIRGCPTCIWNTEMYGQIK